MKKFAKPLLLCFSAVLVAGCGEKELALSFKEASSEVSTAVFQTSLMGVIAEYKAFNIKADTEPFAYVLRGFDNYSLTLNGEVQAESSLTVDFRFDLKHQVAKQASSSTETGKEDEKQEYYYYIKDGKGYSLDAINKVYEESELGEDEEKQFALAMDSFMSATLIGNLNYLLGEATSYIPVKTYVDDNMYTIDGTYTQGENSLAIKMQVVFGEEALTANFSYDMQTPTARELEEAVFELDFKQETVKAPKLKDYEKAE